MKERIGLWLTAVFAAVQSLYEIFSKLLQLWLSAGISGVIAAGLKGCASDCAGLGVGFAGAGAGDKRFYRLVVSEDCNGC